MSAFEQHTKHGNQRLRLAIASALLLAGLSFVLSAMPCLSMTAYADSQETLAAATTDNTQITWTYEVNSSNEAVITGYSPKNSATAIDVPETLGGHPVVEFASSVFKGDTKLKTVYFPSSVKKLGNSLFNGCTNLETVGLAAMEGLGAIPDGCFNGCTKLDNVSIPSAVIQIGINAFYGCTSLKTINFPTSGKLSKIGKSAFQNCTALESLDLPIMLDNIDLAAFAGCTKLSSIKFRATNMSYIGVSAFQGCSALKELYLPDNTFNLAQNAFKDCTKLKTVSFGKRMPDGIDPSVFSGCPIELMIFPVTKGTEDYEEPSDDAKKQAGWKKNDTAWISIIYDENDTGNDDVKIFKIHATPKHTVVNLPAAIGQHDITMIVDEAAWKDRNLTQIVFPSDCKISFIDGWAFRECTNLKSITIPSSLKKLDECTFMGCTSLNTIEFQEPVSLEDLGAATFRDCTSLTYIQLPEGIKTVNEACFYNCTEIDGVYLPDSIQNVGSRAFSCDAGKYMKIRYMRMPNSSGDLFLPSDRDFFESWIVNRDRNTFKFLVTYGSTADVSWFEPHILGDPQFYPITLPESDRAYVQVDLEEKDSNGEYTVKLEWDQNVNYTGGQVLPTVTATRWLRTDPIGVESGFFVVEPADGDNCTGIGPHQAVVKAWAPANPGYAIFMGSRTIDYTIVGSTVDNVQMEPITPDCVWDDQKWNPSPTFYVPDAGGTKTTLVKGQDYKITRYEHNKLPTSSGTASITIEGMGTYQGTKTFPFTIKPATLSAETVKAEVADQEYTGEALTPVPDKVLLKDRNGEYTVKLYEGANKDYVVKSYANNTEAGQATMTLAPRNGCAYLTGEVEAHFNIVKSGYTVKFDANVPANASTKCTGTMDDQYFTLDEKKALSQNAFLLPGYTFDGWNTKADGTGTAYTNGAEVEDLAAKGSTVTLYAQWSAKSYDITFNSSATLTATTQTHTQTTYFDQPGNLDTYSDGWGWTPRGTLHGWTGIGLGSFYEDGEDFLNLCGEPDSNGNLADVNLTAEWVQDGQIVVTVTKDGAPQGGLASKLSLTQEGTGFAVPVTDEGHSGTYVFDPTGMTVGGNPAQLPEGTYNLSFDADDYPTATTSIEYGSNKQASAVFDYYTVSLAKDPAFAEQYTTEISGGGNADEPNAKVALDGGTLHLKTTVESGYRFAGYTVVGVTPGWEGGDPLQAEQDIEVQGTAEITAHVEVDDYAVTVVGGTAEVSRAMPGETVFITASEPESGKAFVQWTSDEVGFNPADATMTAFTMPAQDVTVTAVCAPIVIGSISDKTYTGKPIEPYGEINVSLEGVDLLLDSHDYEVSFKDNVEAGTATATVTMNSPRAGSASTTFKILEPPITYTLVSGPSGPVKQGVGATVELAFKRNYKDETTLDHLTSVRFDGQELPKTAYDTRRGSAIIALRADFIDSVKPGDHTLVAVFDDGQGSAAFSILAPDGNGADNDADAATDSDTGADGTTSPNMGDNNGPLVLALAACALASLCALAVSTARLRKPRGQHAKHK